MLLCTLGCMHLFKLVFSFSSDTLKSVIAGSYGGSIFRVLRILHAVFQSGYINWHTHQRCTSVSFSPQPMFLIHFISFYFMYYLASNCSFSCFCLLTLILAFYWLIHCLYYLYLPILICSETLQKFVTWF